METITIRKISLMNDKEKKLRQHKKELNSFRNKMGTHIVWFDALANNRQYDLLFLWKREKHNKKDITEPTKSKYEYGNPYRLHCTTYIKYPASIKHFLETYLKDMRFQPSKVRIREASLNLILNKK